MCALFGSSRDVSFIRRMNRELLDNIITQQCALYKYRLDKTPVNMYGEASTGRTFESPVLLNALITLDKVTNPTSELGVNFDWPISFAFLRDDLVDANIHPDVGDVILYQEYYWEIDNTNITQYFAGKDPDFPYSPNPLNPGLENFGYSVGIVCECHYVPGDRINLQPYRL